MRVSRFLSTVCLLVLSGGLAACTMGRAKPVTRWPQATGGEHLERLFWGDIKAGNWAELERHMASNWVSVTPEGPLGREATLAQLKGRAIKDYTLSDLLVEPSGSDLIISYTARLDERLAGGGSPGPRQFRMLTVWQQMKSGWIAIAHSEVPVLR